MWEVNDNELVRYRCHVGHAYTAELMSVALEENVRRALASALRALEERVALADGLIMQATEKGPQQVAEAWTNKKQELEREVGVIRAAIAQAEELPAHGSPREQPNNSRVRQEEA